MLNSMLKLPPLSIDNSDYKNGTQPKQKNVLFWFQNII